VLSFQGAKYFERSSQANPYRNQCGLKSCGASNPIVGGLFRYSHINQRAGVERFGLMTLVWFMIGYFVGPEKPYKVIWVNMMRYNMGYGIPQI
jgi:hypothetical protein